MTEQYDVAIIGAGFEGSLVATILAYKGKKVLLIDSASHPRFALGESTVRHTFRMMKIMGERFGVPELKEKFSSGEAVHKRITSCCGEKRDFGFVYHREGQHQIPDEATQLVIPPFREGYEAHLFRQDIDASLTHTAIHHGTTYRPNTIVTGVDIDQQGATLTTKQGEKFQARYVLDGSGFVSVLSRAFNLRDTPPRLNINTRCLFTHMIDVKPYDDLNLPHGVPRGPERWYNGTCHHLFHGGWLWVIPFNNREGSTNPLVSVGLSFDCNMFPKPTDLTPEQEWKQFLSRFPSIYEQFKDAKAVRPWISSDRLQQSSKTAFGYRFGLLAAAHGSGYIDALFSRGLANCVECINALVPLLLKALDEDDFAPERFAYVQTLMENNLRNNDRMTTSAYASFRSFETWNAWFRIWALGVGLGDLRLASIYRRYLKTRDESILPDAEEPMGLFYSNHAGFKMLFDQSVAQMAEYRAGRASSKDTADYIFKLVREAEYAPPANMLWDPQTHFINAGAPATLLRTGLWLLSQAPPDIKKLTFGALSDFGPLRLLARNRPAPSAG